MNHEEIHVDRGNKIRITARTNQLQYVWKNQIHENSLLWPSLHITNVENEQFRPSTDYIFPKRYFGNRECPCLVPTISMVALRWKEKMIFVLISNVMVS